MRLLNLSDTGQVNLENIVDLAAWYRAESALPPAARLTWGELRRVDDAWHWARNWGIFTKMFIVAAPAAFFDNWKKTWVHLLVRKDILQNGKLDKFQNLLR